MPLHFTGLVSRHGLDHPDEKSPVRPDYERVMKYNPNHGPDGKFSSSGSGGGGSFQRGKGMYGPGGPTSSAHTKGMAVDIASPAYRGITSRTDQQRANIARDVEKFKDKLSPETYAKYKALAAGAKPSAEGVTIGRYNAEIAARRPVPMPHAGEVFTGDPHFNRQEAPFTGDPGMNIDIASPAYRGVPGSDPYEASMARDLEEFRGKALAKQRAETPVVANAGRRAQAYQALGPQRMDVDIASPAYRGITPPVKPAPVLPAPKPQRMDIDVASSAYRGVPSGKSTIIQPKDLYAKARRRSPSIMQSAGSDWD